MTDSNRRPLASRQTLWANDITVWLAKTGITPNQISMGSICFAALAGLFFAASGSSDGFLRVALLVSAALCCQLRLLCNLFDGMVAVEAGKQTNDGVAWNEFPDRIADLLILAGCGIGAGVPALGWAAASFAILTAYVRELGVANQMPADFAGPMAKQHRMAVLTIACVIALFEPLALGLEINVLEMALWIVAVGAAVTSIRRILHLLHFLNQATP